MVRIYELTDKHYAKYLVRGIKNDAEGKRLAKKVFGKYYWATGVSYYANVGDRQILSMTKSQFMKYKWRYK